MKKLLTKQETITMVRELFEDHLKDKRPSEVNLMEEYKGVAKVLECSHTTVSNMVKDIVKDWKYKYKYLDAVKKVIKDKEKAEKRELREKYGKLFKVFDQMKQRCYSPAAHNYKWYGAKGVQICDEWFYDKYAFVNWALDNGYEEGLTIDRLNSSDDYKPSNCQWISQSENSKKMAEGLRKKVAVTKDGTTLVFSSTFAASDFLEVHQSTVVSGLKGRQRTVAGWTVKYEEE